MPVSSDDQMYELVCKRRFDELATQQKACNEQLGVLVTALLGNATNDQAKPGLLSRVRRLEEHAAARLWLLRLLVAGVLATFLTALAGAIFGK